MKKRFFLLISIILHVLTSCASIDNIVAAEASPTPPPQNMNLTPSPMPSAPDPTAQTLIRQAQTQLAQKVGIEANNIFLFSVEPVEWPNASLGCPQEGISYAQVVTPGYRITFEAEGKVYTFHTDKEDRVILCTARGPDEIYLPP